MIMEVAPEKEAAINENLDLAGTPFKWHLFM